jgi:hypothetical protein
MSFVLGVEDDLLGELLIDVCPKEIDCSNPAKKRREQSLEMWVVGEATTGPAFGLPLSLLPSMSHSPKVQRAVRWYPPRYDIRVEDDVLVPE